MTEFAIIAASLATCITAIIILFTLFEMKTQRNLSFKPTLVPIRQSIYTSKQEEYFCWREVREIAEENAQFFTTDYPLHIYNLGNGAAKNIRTKWILDIQNIIDTINSICQKNMSQVYFELDEKNWMKINNKGSSKANINTTLDMEGEYDHLMPASIDKEGINVRMPLTFLILSSYYFFEGGKSKDGTTTLGNKPEIKLQISYEDIAGTKYVINYRFSLSLIMYSESFFHAILENKTET